MNSYMELRYLRGDQTVEGIVNYLDFLESRINHHFQFKNEEILFGESEGDGTDKYIGGYSHFSVPEWLSMGRDIEEWLAYALSLEMTNYYINSSERVEKENIRATWINHISELRSPQDINRRVTDKTDSKSINREDRIRFVNEKLAQRKEAALISQKICKEIRETDCLSSIANKRKEIISYIRSLEEKSQNENKPIDELFAHQLDAACDRIKSYNHDDFMDIDKRSAETKSIINDMFNATIQYIKNNHIHWQERADDLSRIVNEDENRYNIPFMKAMFQIYKKTDHELSVFDVNNAEISRERKTIPAEVRREVWRRDKGQCSKCGSRQNLEYDHIVPISKGGSNTTRNIELLCQECNRIKSNKIS